MSEVFAFEWCDCIFESGFAVVSLHRTKRSAVSAMTAEANARWHTGRNDQAIYNCEGKRRYDPLVYQAWRVRKVEVLP